MTMTPSSVAPALPDYQRRSTNLRSKILKNEEQRMQLEQRLRALASQSSRSYQHKQIQHIQTYFNRLNQESQRAEQRNLQLLNELSHAQQRLDRLHFDAEHLIDLKNDYLTYLETNYPNWQKPTSMRSSVNVASSTEFDRLVENMKQGRHQQLENEGNLRQSGPLVRQSYDVDSSTLFRHYEDQLKTRLERTISPSTPMLNNDNRDDLSFSESNDAPNPLARAKRTGSHQKKLTRDGLYFLLDYMERELKDAVDKRRFYAVESPTVTQTSMIIDIANEQQRLALEDLDATTVSMVILEKLSPTIRRTTVNQCLLTEEILSANIQDLDKDSIARMLPEADRALWLRLIEHFIQLLRCHIMDMPTLVTKFALKLVPERALYVHDKAKSLLKHVVDKLMRAPSASVEDDSFPRNELSSTSQLRKLAHRAGYEDEDDESKSASASSPTVSGTDSPGASPPVTPRTRFRQSQTDDTAAVEQFFT